MYARSKQCLFELLFRSGLAGIFRYLHRNSVLVLIYHDILAPGFPENNPLFGMTVSSQEFDRQLSYLQRHYHAISLQQFLAWFAGECVLPPCPVLITFDDGHRNNLQYALPLLRKRNLPAVCFTLAGNLGETCLTWFEAAYYRIMFSTATEVRTRDGRCLPLTTDQQRAGACGQLFVLFRSLSETQQRQELAHILEQLPVGNRDGAREFRERFRFLSSHDLRVLAQDRVEIGAHSLSHPILRTLEPDAASEEISQSKRKIETLTGLPVRAFAYPFGEPGLDFGERECRLVQQSGFAVAFAGSGGFVNQGSNPFALPRIGIGRMSHAQFVATITGSISSLKKLLRLRN